MTKPSKIPDSPSTFLRAVLWRNLHPITAENRRLHTGNRLDDGRIICNRSRTTFFLAHPLRFYSSYAYIVLSPELHDLLKCGSTY